MFIMILVLADNSVLFRTLAESTCEDSSPMSLMTLESETSSCQEGWIQARGSLEN